MRRCKHKNWGWVLTVQRAPDPDGSMLIKQCHACHAWLPLGPSSDDSPDVAIELYALEQLDWARGMTAAERDAILNSGEMCGVGCIYCEGAYLACAISSHATTEGE